MIRPPPISTRTYPLLPYTTLFRSARWQDRFCIASAVSVHAAGSVSRVTVRRDFVPRELLPVILGAYRANILVTARSPYVLAGTDRGDRKSTRLNSSH